MKTKEEIIKAIIGEKHYQVCEGRKCACYKEIYEAGKIEGFEKGVIAERAKWLCRLKVYKFRKVTLKGLGGREFSKIIIDEG